MQNSYELLKKLIKLNLIEENNIRWWPNYGTFEVIVGAILTQQTKWEKVEKALKNLREKEYLNLEALIKIDIKELAFLIKPSGFYNTKAKRLKRLSENIYKEYQNFENFKESVSREWLLSQSGVGEETADSILCYGCLREEMVVDNYTNRLLKAFGYQFETYQEIKEWLESGILEKRDRIILFDKNYNLNIIYSYFHGAIVEYCKIYCKGRNINIDKLKEIE